LVSPAWGSWAGPRGGLVQSRFGREEGTFPFPALKWVSQEYRDLYRCALVRQISIDNLLGKSRHTLFSAGAFESRISAHKAAVFERGNLAVLIPLRPTKKSEQSLGASKLIQRALDVCFGSKAQEKILHFDVRFTPRKRTFAATQTDVCFGPIPDIRRRLRLQTPQVVI
jgi:hypothetical protein